MQDFPRDCGTVDTYAVHRSRPTAYCMSMSKLSPSTNLIMTGSVKSTVTPSDVDVVLASTLFVALISTRTLSPWCRYKPVRVAELTDGAIPRSLSINVSVEAPSGKVEVNTVHYIDVTNECAAMCLCVRACVCVLFARARVCLSDCMGVGVGAGRGRGRGRGHAIDCVCVSVIACEL